jgi:hypothetical protein
MRNRSVRDSRSPRHHIHYGHHHMGEGVTSAAEKEKNRTLCLGFPSARRCRPPPPRLLSLLIDLHHVSGGRKNETRDWTFPRKSTYVRKLVGHVSLCAHIFGIRSSLKFVERISPSFLSAHNNSCVT